MLTFDKIGQIIFVKKNRIMNSLGENIRRLREEKKLPLRKVAAFLDIDQALLSKIERGQRKASRDQVVKLSAFFNVDEKDLLVSWLSDRLVHEVSNESFAVEALHVAEKRVTYQTMTSESINLVISQVRQVLKGDGRVAAAWMFGSVASGKATSKSDVDLIIEFNREKKYSMLDLLDLAYLLEKKINRKIDLVETGQLKDFAIESANLSLQKIYG
jgi:predicted nucleotidyltransferase/plasmid maintenance system antidote protein VapI